MQIFRDKNIQESKYSRIKIFKNKNIIRNKNKDIQGIKIFKVVQVRSGHSIPFFRL